MNICAEKKIKEDEWHLYEAMCVYSSQREKEAPDAERASIKYKQVEYMSSRVGQVFDGVISSVTDWGIYVEEKKLSAKEWSNSATSAMIFMFLTKKLSHCGRTHQKTLLWATPCDLKSLAPIWSENY